MQTARVLALALLVPAAALAVADENTSLYGAVAHARAEWDPWEDAHQDQTSGGDLATFASVNVTVPGARASASTSLASGALHVGAFTDASAFGPNTGVNSVFSGAGVTLWDTVTLFCTGASVARIPLHVELDGNATKHASIGFKYRGWSTHTEWGGPAEGIDSYSLVDDLVVSPLSGYLTFKVQVALSVSAGMLYYETKPVYADYTHTLKFKWDLPEGVTYTSASGEFHPQPLTPVPEPASLLALGLPTLALLRRRKRA